MSYYRVDISTFRSDEVRAPGKEVAAVTQKCYDAIGAEQTGNMPVILDRITAPDIGARLLNKSVRSGTRPRQ